MPEDCSYHLPLFCTATAASLALLMSKTLVIAEKPSVANDIARALGGFTRHDDYFESDDARRHLGRRPSARADRRPTVFEVKRGKWSFNNLPVIPPHFDLQPIAKIGSAPEAAGQAHPAQGRRHADQRLRRRPRGRADLSLHRSVLQSETADAAPVAAIDDAGGDSRGIRRGCATIARCCRSPTRRSAAPKPTG